MIVKEAQERWLPVPEWEKYFDILPALKDGDSHNWRHMSVPGKDI